WNKGRGHRVVRDWFKGKYLYSLYRLKEVEASFYGKAYQGMVSETLTAMFSGGLETSKGKVSI
ncbi:MAG: hypothetical protein PUG74_04860, partial [Prevotellaceae bacterium]|nr:hypothetical protein [Prevotellaceae bacterium]